jgi:glycosyltransferase domain-containing protein
MFTIIIPTFERHDILLRTIDYYQHFDCNVLIADSSDNKFIHKFSDNIIYKHFPKTAFAKKISEATKNVTTPYVCVGADDDYFIQSSLKTGACFLDDNPDYASVQGRYYKFELIKNQVAFSPRYALYSNHYAVESEDRFSRIISAFNPYFHHLFAIHRTDLFIKCWKFLSVSELSGDSTDQFDSCELLQPLVPMCYGKHKALPILWVVRDSYIFDPIRRKKNLTALPMVNYSAYHNYNRYARNVQSVKAFLSSEDCRLLKESFRKVISDLVSSKESDLLFNAVFISYIKWIISVRNKVIKKIILKLFIPNWVLNNYKTRTENHQARGIEDTVFKNDFEKIRLSILHFRKFYDNYIMK